MRLRRARVADAAAIVELVIDCFEEYREFAPPGWQPPDHSGAVARTESALVLPGTAGTVATQAGAHVGHVLWIPAADTKRIDASDSATAFLWQLFVAVLHRGSGLASRLLAEALHEARSRGFREFRLQTVGANERARRFYEREGWTLLGDWGTDPELGLALVEYGIRLRRVSGQNKGR